MHPQSLLYACFRSGLEFSTPSMRLLTDVVSKDALFIIISAPLGLSLNTEVNLISPDELHNITHFSNL